MAILRILAWLLVGLALMLLGADAIATLESGVPEVRTTAEVIALFGPELDYLEGGGIGKVANFLLAAPLWAIVGIVGVVLTLVFRPIS